MEPTDFLKTFLKHLQTGEIITSLDGDAPRGAPDEGWFIPPPVRQQLEFVMKHMILDE